MLGFLDKLLGTDNETPLLAGSSFANILVQVSSIFVPPLANIINTDGRGRIQNRDRINDRIAQESINKFLADLQPYISYYEELNRINSTAEKELTGIDYKFALLREDIEFTRTQVFESLGLKLNDTPDAITLSINNKFKFSPENNLTVDDYRSVNENLSIKTAVQFSSEIRSYLRKVKLLSEEYLMFQINLCTKYIEILEKNKDSIFNPTLIDSKIEELKAKRNEWSNVLKTLQ